MKYILLHIILLSGLIQAQDSFERVELRERALEFSITKGSKFFVRGETNVNKFDCAFDDSQLLNTPTFKGTVYNRKITFSDAQLALPVKSLDCGNKMMNNDLLELLQASQHPEIKVEFIQAFWYLETLWKDKLSEEAPIGYFNVRLFIAGTQRTEQIQIYSTSLDKGKRVLTTEGIIEIDMREFGINPPSKFFGMVQVKEKLKIYIDLNFTWQESLFTGG